MKPVDVAPPRGSMTHDDLRAAAQAATPLATTQFYPTIPADAAFRALASPDRILALLDELERPRWHHDRSLSPEDRHYCDDCDTMARELERKTAGLERIATAMELGTYGVSREDIAAVARAALEGKP